MQPRVVLVGSGHAHALVLERWAEKGPTAVRLTLVTASSDGLYSGMIPGLVAGEYTRDELVLDARVMAERAGARLEAGRVTEIDDDAALVFLENGTSLPYDLLSLDVGSTLAGIDDPGVREAVVPARPPDELLDRIGRLGDGSPVVVVGGGAAGIELAACLAARLRTRDRVGGGSNVTLVEGGARLLAGYQPSVASRVQHALEKRGVEVRLQSPVLGADATTVHLESGEAFPSALTVWATGSAPQPLLARTGLPVDRNGFLAVDPTLRVRGRERIFAAGDCASIEGEHVPKAGVHAVRQAPVLFHNLTASAGSRLVEYEPQDDFLTLLNLGDGTAIGTKWGHVAEGRWVRRLKDVIDRRFVRRFQA
ncbi:MAG: FAD-dependent oxidoreductase [Gemmatimonadota bacterium]|nr:FAD-dependent oxidoreductase [Gemmatimonadota bacterium]MDH3424941.1 FAD-dependent oxidoreductase [Gemmatimonadota bacterium]